MGYVWKTKKNETLNVLQSLCDCEEVVNNIDDTWMQELVTDIAEKVADEIKNVAVGEQVAAAENAAIRAESAADSAEQTVTNALVGYATEEYVNAAVDGVDVTEQLNDYALITYVDDAVASVDVTEQLESYVKHLI